MASSVIATAVLFVVDESDIAVSGCRIAREPVTAWTKTNGQQVAFEDFVDPREFRYFGNWTKRDGTDLTRFQRPIPLKQSLEVDGDWQIFNPSNITFGCMSDFASIFSEVIDQVSSDRE